MKFEVTVLADGKLTDRCVLEAENTADAARKYAELFEEG